MNNGEFLKSFIRIKKIKKDLCMPKSITPINGDLKTILKPIGFNDKSWKKFDN